MAERVTIAGLQAQLADVTAERDGLRVQVSDLEKAVARLTEQAIEAGTNIVELRAGLAASEAEAHTLRGQLRAYKGSATKARNEAALLKAGRSPAARRFGPLPAPKDEPELAVRRAAIDSAIAAGPVTIVFSDGRRELLELDPLIVTGDAWRKTARGQILQLKPLFEPGDMARPKVDIAGVALLDEAGEQVGWRQFPETVEVPRNGRVELPIGGIFF